MTLSVIRGAHDGVLAPATSAAHPARPRTARAEPPRRDRRPRPAPRSSWRGSGAGSPPPSRARRPGRSARRRPAWSRPSPAGLGASGHRSTASPERVRERVVALGGRGGIDRRLVVGPDVEAGLRATGCSACDADGDDRGRSHRRARSIGSVVRRLAASVVVRSRRSCRTALRRPLARGRRGGGAASASSGTPISFTGRRRGVRRGRTGRRGRPSDPRPPWASSGASMGGGSRFRGRRRRGAVVGRRGYRAAPCGGPAGRASARRPHRSSRRRRSRAPTGIDGSVGSPAPSEPAAPREPAPAPLLDRPRPPRLRRRLGAPVPPGVPGVVRRSDGGAVALGDRSSLGGRCAWRPSVGAGCRGAVGRDRAILVHLVSSLRSVRGSAT